MTSSAAGCLPTFLERLGVFEEAVELALPDRLAGERIEANGRPVVTLRALPGDALSLRVCLRWLKSADASL